MITEIQLDSLIRAIEGGWVTMDQVPKELKVLVSERLKSNPDSE